MPNDALTQKILSYYPDADISRVQRAMEFARQAHAGQYRDSGEEYFQHPYEVALILADLQMDVDTIVAGLLHDVLEDTSVTREVLAEQFGEPVARLVEGVTKLAKISFMTREEQQARSLRKMFLAMAEDLRVIVIKLADRLHNMRTLRHLSAERQRRIATETLEIYAPLAHRLGMWSIKWEMEDLAFRTLYPDEYAELVRQIAKRREQREKEIQSVIEQLQARLKEVGIQATLQGRPKHLYSIWQKLKRQGTDLSKIYDLMAVRVIVDTVKDCYGVLGLVHTMWKPIPGRFKDYIAMPKSNMYQSLHTTVVGPSGEPLEIQIRTHEMHRVAEMGIAAHWLYKEGRSSSEFEEKVAWLRQVMEWLREMKDPQEFMETLKIDLFEDEVFVFTPKGDVKSLPAGSTPIDFAFAVHTDIGMHCVGARVNGKMVPLDYRLQNGEFVEILTSKNARPSQDWLSIVKTSKARSKIRSYFKELHREESKARGKEMLEREAKRLGLEPAEVFKVDRLNEVAKRYGLADADDLYAGVGFGKVTVAQVLSRLIGRQELEARRRQVRERQRKNGAHPGGRPEVHHRGVIVEGVENVLVRFSRCCNPVPGDEIVGYITRGRGVSVHRRDCPNLLALNDEGRRIEVRWERDPSGTYPVEILVEAVDRANLLANIIESINDGITSVGAVNARTDRQRNATINIIVDIHDVEHMKNVINRIKQVEGVLHVERARPS
ncbi:MAG: bifunctional (p)ppGpp synthetase/guanosine-3',5'-bis(diphosphate) 3'-pyrophosphohydrolase [Limnochordales bacterium]